MGKGRTSPEKERVAAFLEKNKQVFYDGTLTYDEAMYMDMYYFGEHTMQEVADEFDTYEQTVSKKISQARSKLRAKFGGFGV